jgi:hypothetical protein
VDLTIAPTLSGEALLSAAERLLKTRKLRSAIRLFNQAEMQGADSDRCASERWIAQMLLGNFPAAWDESDNIRMRGTAGPQCFWQGEDIVGKNVVVRCLHGLGDSVQFLRYAPQLNKIAANVIWEVPPAFLELAPFFNGVDHAATWESAPRNHEWEIQVEVMELPYLFRTRVEELPLATKYLCVSDEIIHFIASQMGKRTMPRVGIVWEAGDWNRSRSLPTGCLDFLLRSKMCEFWNLQGGTERNNWPKSDERRFRDIEACNNGILSMAAVISQLDLVITVDTLAAHLAGAMGIPAWVLLQFAADWRWMIERNDSPWYPSLRLFRQPSPGDWMTLIAHLTDALHEWLQSEDRRLTA